ncbi:hypothetical protein DUNSADRAFT_16126 [Dunaliella salina]|uniref:Uncharacterized protein n=1 Tax=Dunaliella salina TaxID=3046 RepID=A0ABQ7H177_DUNSA|nr:hypothetical protein DUNSADRAFT_16126 [Dunaliella salina]|eukprot:KAF5840611.1 hypothetical protein DUNSADRAFT_16126 [Dunaliella salina]
MRSVLPPATLAHRLNLLKEAASYVNPRVDQVPQRTLLLVGSDDRVIPSGTEGPRLKFRMARCRLEVLEGRSHAMLQEAGVDIMAIMSDTGFYMPKRKLTSTYQTKDSKGGRRNRGGSNGNNLSSSNGTGGAASTNGSGPHQNGSTNGTTLATTAAAAAEGNGRKGSASESNGSSTSQEVPMGGSANFGKPLPVEVPTPKEIEFACREGGIVSVANLDRLVSPVFFSTDAETGQVIHGLGAVPLGQPGRPVLLIGNHELFAPDMPFMVVMHGLGGVPTGEGRPGGRAVLFIGNHQPPAPDMFLVVVQFLKEKGVLLRGLAHPAVFMGTMELLQQSMTDDGENSNGDGNNMGPGAFLRSLMNNLTGRGGGPATPEQQQEQVAEERQTANFFSSFLTTFGAVPVSGFSLYNLLSQGETCFMFPGGAREVRGRSLRGVSWMSRCVPYACLRRERRASCSLGESERP